MTGEEGNLTVELYTRLVNPAKEGAPVRSLVCFTRATLKRDENNNPQRTVSIWDLACGLTPHGSSDLGPEQVDHLAGRAGKLYDRRPYVVPYGDRPEAL